jgi:hypothetical protein
MTDAVGQETPSRSVSGSIRERSSFAENANAVTSPTKVSEFFEICPALLGDFQLAMSCKSD